MIEEDPRGDGQASVEQPAEKDAAGKLPPQARRALAEAEERRAAQERAESKLREKEVGGRDGPEPTRYGDWEKGGIVADF